jgi:hypothetical protein
VIRDAIFIEDTKLSRLDTVRSGGDADGFRTGDSGKIQGDSREKP